MGIDDILNRLEAAEQDFLLSSLLAPVLPGQPVRVRLAGVVCQLQADDPKFEGWAILRPMSRERAKIERPASLAEVAAYLGLFPAVPLILLARKGRRWSALPAHKGDTRFRLDGPVPVLLAEEGLEAFDVVMARFDGRLFWYERRDSRHNPALAAYLRQAFNEQLAPEKLHKKMLSAEERAAYAEAWKVIEEARRNSVEGRLAEALSHAGGKMLSFLERADVYTVTYQVGQQQHVSTVRKDDLTVVTAGICLSGRDRDFDLTSLVGVLREARARHAQRVFQYPQTDRHEGFSPGAAPLDDSTE
jgi:hypothetical protein